MREETYEAIAALAVQMSGAQRDRLTPQTRLARDLGLDGDEAGEFMDAFATKFDVDMEGFYWLRYFGDEGWNMLTPATTLVARALSPAFRRRWRAAQEAEREITLAHLTEVVEAGRWVHPGTEHLPSRKSHPIARPDTFLRHNRHGKRSDVHRLRRDFDLRHGERSNRRDQYCRRWDGDRHGRLSVAHAVERLDEHRTQAGQRP